MPRKVLLLIALAGVDMGAGDWSLGTYVALTWLMSWQCEDGMAGEALEYEKMHI